MAAFTFNVSKGRTHEFHLRVDGNDPANSALIVVVLASSGLEPDTTLRAYDTLSALLAASNNEPTNTNYARKTLTDSDLTAPTVDDVNNRVTLPFPTQTWTSVGAGDAWRKLLICYDSDTTAGTDANIIPVTAHDLLIAGSAIIPSGANIVVTGSNGWMIAR
jgi:hypothetical protein